MEFNVGDIIEIVNENFLYNPLIKNGMTGTILVVDSECANVDDFDFGVCFDSFIDGHDLAGKCENGYGWWITKYNLKGVRKVGDVGEANIEVGDFL